MVEHFWLLPPGFPNGVVLELIERRWRIAFVVFESRKKGLSVRLRTNPV